MIMIKTPAEIIYDLIENGAPLNDFKNFKTYYISS